MSSHLAPPVVYRQDVESLSRASSTSNSVTTDDISEKRTGIGSSRCSIITVDSCQTAVEVSGQPELVTWSGPDDPSNPRNWSRARKWRTSLIVSSFALVSPLSSSVAAPALNRIGTDLHIPIGLDLQLVLSIFLLSYAFGPFFMSSCSETWGRAGVLRYGNLVFILFTFLCGFATSETQIKIFRFLAGIGGSASIGMGTGVLTDCWCEEERGRGMAIYQLAPVLGPAVGPIAGAYICEYVSWRWVFWMVAIFSTFLQLVAQFGLNETYAPRILQLKARRLRHLTGDDQHQTRWEMEQRTLGALLRTSLIRPWKMLATQPIIQLLAVYQAFNFGVFYLIISGFPMLWEVRYGFSKGDASLNYIALALGSLVGVNICGPLTDATYAYLKRRHGIPADQPGLPEFRVPLMLPAAVVWPCGIFLFAWSAEAKLHFLLPDLGVALFGMSSIIIYQSMSSYIADTFNLYSASASAACAFLRSFGAFLLPLFAVSLFDNLGYGWGGSVIGLIAVMIGIPTPILLWVFGTRLRERSHPACLNRDP